MKNDENTPSNGKEAKKGIQPLSETFTKDFLGKTLEKDKDLIEAVKDLRRVYVVPLGSGALNA